MNPSPQVVFNVNDMITLTAKLAQVLAQEADYLQEMKISKIADLQKEKLLLTSALELQKKHLEKDPYIMGHISPEEKEDLRTVVGIFDAILRENHRRLLTAKEVNMRVVEAITDVVTETSNQGVYNEKGAPDAVGRDALSVTLNKTI